MASSALIVLGVPRSTYVETELGLPELDLPVNVVDLPQGDGGSNRGTDLFLLLEDAEVLEGFLSIEKGIKDEITSETELTFGNGRIG